MAQQIQWRAGSASTWTSVNPTLAQGEVGVDNTNNIFKIGDGSTAWSSLPIAPTTSPTQTKPFKSLGDGSDGNVVISSGTTTLLRDMYYNNLTINGTGSISTNGFKIFVKGVLDLTNAPTNAINANGAVGGDASGNTPGSQSVTPISGSVGAGAQGTAGASGSAVAGLASTASSQGANGGASNICGSGGSPLNSYTFTVTAGNTASVGAVYTDGTYNYTVTTALTNVATSLVTVGNGIPGSLSGSLTFVSGTGTGPVVYSTFTRAATAAGGANAGATTTGQFFVRRFETNLIRGIATVLGGSGGRGGSSGAGDGINLSGAGGGGGNGGGVVAIYANTILKSSYTASGAIAANGGNGGAGGNSPSGIVGAGGGGAGGGGGWVYLAYNYLAGPTVTNFIQVNGGIGGNGGAGIGGQDPVQTAGQGGGGGYGGRIILFNILSQAGAEVLGDATASKNPEVTSGATVSAPFPALGADGANSGLAQLSI